MFTCFFITFLGLYSRIFISLYRFIFYERKSPSQLVCLMLFSTQLSFTSSKSLHLLVLLNILIGYFCISVALFSYSKHCSFSSHRPPSHCTKSVRIRSYSVPYFFRVWIEYVKILTIFPQCLSMIRFPEIFQLGHLTTVHSQ